MKQNYNTKKETISDKIGYGLASFMPAGIAGYYQLAKQNIDLKKNNYKQGTGLNNKEIEAFKKIYNDMKIDTIFESENNLINIESRLSKFKKINKNYDIKFYDKETDKFNFDNNEIIEDLVRGSAIMRHFQLSYMDLTDRLYDEEDKFYEGNSNKDISRKTIIHGYSGAGKLRGFYMSCKETGNFIHNNKKLLEEGIKLYIGKKNAFEDEINKWEKELSKEYLEKTSIPN